MMAARKHRTTSIEWLSRLGSLGDISRRSAKQRSRIRLTSDLSSLFEPLGVNLNFVAEQDSWLQKAWQVQAKG